MFKFYDEYLDKQEVIKRLNQIIESKMSLTTTTTEEVIKEVFENCRISYDQRTLEMCDDIINQCLQQDYSAFKAAGVICQELEIEMRWNRGAIEKALITKNIFNK